MTNHIKIHGVVPRKQYVADGTLATYEFPFAIFSADDIEVYLDDIKQSSATYSVSGVRESDGGSVTFTTAPTSGTVITIVRNLSIERTSDFQEGGALRADTLNDELDYQIACQQQIADNLNRTMIFPPYAIDADVDLTLPTPSAGKAIIWNADGTNLENSTVAINALESTLNGYKTAAEAAATTATTKAGIASDKADIAATQAGIATEKATEAATLLSSKANKDMDNLSNTGKSQIVALCAPDYSAGTSRSNNTEYTANTNGWLEFFIYSYSTNTKAYLYINGVEKEICIGKSPDHLSTNYCLIPIKSGTTYKIIFSHTESSQYINFYPCIGG